MTVADPAFLQEALRLATQAAQEAGTLALKSFRPGAQTSASVQYKEGGSPVTEADLAVDRLLKERLSLFDSTIGWLSEETEDDPSRLGRDLVWVVDPIDGTRSFASGKPDWGVAIALLETGQPVLGVLLIPVEDKLYTACRGGGAHLNGQILSVSRRAEVQGARLAGQQAALDKVEAGVGTIIRAPRVHSLAYRLAMAADGSVDAALSSKSPHDWDLAASHALLSEAGGVLRAADGSALHYNRVSTRHEAVVAGHPHLVDKLAAILTP